MGSLHVSSANFNTSAIEPHTFPDGAFQKLRRRLLLPLSQTMTLEHLQFDGVKTGRPAGGRVTVVSMTSSLLLVRCIDGECVIFMCGVTIMNRRTDSCSSPVPACDDGFPY